MSVLEWVMVIVLTVGATYAFTMFLLIGLSSPHSRSRKK